MNNYDDIINLPAYHEPSRPYMSLYDRAAQFMPYKSLGDAQDEIEQAKKRRDGAFDSNGGRGGT